MCVYVCVMRVHSLVGWRVACVVLPALACQSVYCVVCVTLPALGEGGRDVVSLICPLNRCEGVVVFGGRLFLALAS